MWSTTIIMSAIVASALCDQKDGGKAPRIPLNDGNAIPALGIGTFLGIDENGRVVPKGNEIEDPVTWALEAGYRLIDTAAAYQDEDQVGRGVKKSSVKREDIFVVTKLGLSDQHRVVDGLKESLERLNMTYVDLFLIHNPVTFKPDLITFDTADYVDTWRGMEEAQRLGLARSIGISNFNITQIERLLQNSQVKPAVLQIEVNLNLAQPKMREFCKQHGIVIMAYTPFGSLLAKNTDAPPPRVDDPKMVAIGKKYGKTVPQIALKYLVQLGLSAIPKSARKNRIEENIDLFDFELSPEEMQELAKFNKDYRTINPTFWQDSPYYPYEKSDHPLPNPFKSATS